MKFRQTVEDHPLWVVTGAVIAASSISWAFFNALVLPFHHNKIVDLERKLQEQPAIALQNSQLRAKVSSLESEVKVTKASAAEWQKSHQDWVSSHRRLEEENKLYSANCSILTEMQKVERSKQDIEASIGRAHYLAGEMDKVPMYERRVVEYHARLLAMADKLSCIAPR